MAFIYKIYFDGTDKVYIGQTSRTIDARFKGHCKAAFVDGSEYAVHRAMRKYGREHCHVELVEETDSPNEREQYWIKLYDSFNNGYNLTAGGEGTITIDRDEVVQAYSELGNQADIAASLGVDVHSVRKILKERSVEVANQQTINQQKNGKPVLQYTLAGEFLSWFPSAKAAAKHLGKIEKNGKGAAGHIFDVCTGKRKSAYGYIWRFANPDDLTEYSGAKGVTMFSLNDEKLQDFESAMAAIEFIGYGNPKVIQDACRKAQQTAYNHIWRYTSECCA